MRVIVANSPRMYREALAIVIRQHSPDSEVMIVAPGDFDGHLESFGPHALVRDDDGTTTYAPDGLVLWVGIAIDDHLNARIAMDGQEVSELRDLSVADFCSALDEVERRLSPVGA